MFPYFIVGTMMPHYFHFQLAAAAGAALLLIAFWRSWPGRRRLLCSALLLVALVCRNQEQRADFCRRREADAQARRAPI